MKKIAFSFIFTLLTCCIQVTQAQDMPGFFDFTWDEQLGKVYLKVKEFDKEFIYVNSLAAGVGSNDIGLDRGQLGNTRIVKFMKAGNKILLIQPNYDYRAVSENPDEVKSVQEAFAQSVIWGFEAVEGDDGYIIDLTGFLLRDAHGIASRLGDQKEGTYAIDPSRSALYKPGTKNFPENSEFEGLVTFKGKPKGQNIRSVTPTSTSFTVRMHHSFIKLPDNDYKPRTFDPRSGYIFLSYQDYATAIDQPLVKRIIARHRLEKKDPSASMSEAVEPIIYYVDRGAPEPVRSALIEGASWWNQAFEAAGFKDAFQVKLLPEGVDPLDVRYNVIQWVHRSTRGWSYGASVKDPRTGEIIKGHVSLGSLRVRQDFLIAEGLMGPYKTEEIPDDMMEMALARLRQLSAHEVGHTIGLAHNFAASISDRASVMDYPHPYFEMDDNGKVTLQDAYDTGIGEWDKVAIKYGYSVFTENEEDQLNGILADAFDNQGLKFITDSDARPPGGAHAYAHLWDNGKDAADELNRLLNIRRKILAEFSENNIREGAPMATIEEVMVPMYFMHRYQLEAAAKLIGGMEFSYAVKGQGGQLAEIVDPAMQRKALSSLLSCLEPGHLALPESLLQKLPPRPFGYYRSRETFKSKTGVAFDAITPAETVSSIVLSFVLHPQRTSRLIEYKSRNSAQLGLEEMIDKIINATWKGSRSTGYAREIERVVEKQVLMQLFKAATNTSSNAQVNAIVLLKIQELEEWIKRSMKKAPEDEKAHFNYALSMIEIFNKKPEQFQSYQAPKPPDGSPIGMDCLSFHD